MSADGAADNGPSFVNPRTIGDPIGLYSHVARSGPGTTYYIAGQVAVDKNGDLVGPDDLSAQLGQTFANIGGALEALGLNFANIAQMTTYLTQREHVGEFYRARSVLFLCRVQRRHSVKRGQSSRALLRNPYRLVRVVADGCWVPRRSDWPVPPSTLRTRELY
jgi:enamine deaminase RidA (YjgF/YER057c/UK114 family)